MEPPLQGSSHQPARERRAVAILRARSIPHRTMGAAILKRTKWNAGPGVRARGGRGMGRARLRRKWTASDASPPARVPLLVRSGPRQYGYGVSAPGKVAGTASFVASRGDRLRLRLRPLHSRRYPRPHDVEEGRVEEKGA